MRLQKNSLRALLTLAIIVIVFSIVVFALPLHMNGVFWLSYLFALASVAVQGYAFYTGFSARDTVLSKFYGFPIIRVGAAYMVVQLVLSLIFMALAAIVPIWLVLIVCVVALAGALIGLIAADAMFGEIEQQDTTLKKDVKTMRALQSKARSIASQGAEMDNADELKAFSEAMQYSDPVNAEALTDIEESLTALTDELEKAVLEGDSSAASALCKKATATLTERNRLCKLNK